MTSNHRFILVTKKTRLEMLIFKYNTIDQARFYIRHMGMSFDDYEQEHENYQKALRQCIEILNRIGKVLQLDRSFLPNYIFDSQDIVVVLGQDGLVANTLKYLNEQKVIAINPDPNRYDGVLLPFKVTQLGTVIADVLAGKRMYKEISMAKAILNNGQSLYAVNDLFIGHKSHVSAKYQISVHNRSEVQSSSGIIISTGLGSTGWLKSILDGAKGIIESATQTTVKMSSLEVPWDANKLYFSVREPFKSKGTDHTIVFGQIVEHEVLTIESRMAQDGRIFSDGIEDDYLEFNAGAIVSIVLCDHKGKLII